MPKPRHSRKRTTLRFLATLLVALGTIAFAASIAMAVGKPDGVGGGLPAGTPINDEGNNNDEEACLGYMVGRACKIDVCNANGTTRSIDYNAFLNGNYTVPPCEGIDEEEEESDPVISVCRNGVVTSIKTSEKLSTDGTVPCPVIDDSTGNSDPDVSVCRAGAVITIPTSQKVATDTTPPCPTSSTPGDSGAAPGAADAGGPVDQGDAPVDGIEYEHDSLAPTNASKDPAVGAEFAVAGAADEPGSADATTVPGSGVSGAVAPANGQLPYTGLSTLQVALLGTMLLGMGALCWLVGSSRTEELAAA